MKSKKIMNPVYRGIAVFDLDGVLADLESGFCDAFGKKDRHLYSLEARYPQMADTVSEWINEPTNYADVNAIFGGMLLMNQTMGRGFYTVIMTARPVHLKSVTERWLNLYNIRPHSLIYSADKAQRIRDLCNYTGMPLIFFVDDNPKQLESVANEFSKDVCVAWEQPWNTEWTPRAWYDEKSMAINIKK